MSQFKSAGAARGTVCTLSHNITQLESRKGRSAGLAAPPGQLRGPGRSESESASLSGGAGRGVMPLGQPASDSESLAGHRD